MSRALWNTIYLARAQTGSWPPSSLLLLPFPALFLQRGNYSICPQPVNADPATHPLAPVVGNASSQWQQWLIFIFCTSILDLGKGEAWTNTPPLADQNLLRLNSSWFPQACQQLLALGYLLLLVKPQTWVKAVWSEAPCRSLARGFTHSPSSEAPVAGCSGVQRGSWVLGWHGTYPGYLVEEVSLGRMVSSFSAVVYLQN